MNQALGVLVTFGLLSAGLCLATVILQAACALYNVLVGVGLGGRPRPMGHAGEMEVAEETRRGSPTGAADRPKPEEKDQPARVPKLEPLQAFGIIFATAVVNALLGFLISKVLRGVGMTGGGGPLGILPIAYLLTLPIGILVMAAMLPTSFGKGLLVALLYLAIWLAVGCVLLAVFFVVGRAIPGRSG